MNQLQEKQLAFLNDTVAFYNSGNRATAFNSKSCLYAPTATSKGCAIGRHLTLDLAENLDNSQRGSGIVNDWVFNMMPEKIKELRQEFLIQVQGLHDEENFWNETGLSDLGKNRVKEIKDRFNLN